jgi:hypothetical protein
LHTYFELPQDREFAQAEFAKISRWRERYGLAQNRVFLGEFGAVRGVGKGAATRNEYRNLYLKDVVDAAGGAGFGYIMWAYCGPYGQTMCDVDAPLDQALLSAIGLR